MNDIVKATVYTTNMNYFLKMNGIYEEFFSNQAQPPRSCVEVGRLAKGAKVKTEAIALVRNP